MAEQNRVVGIDLGTTNSLVAFLEGGIPVVIPGEDGSSLVPTVVAISGDTITVGNGARGTLLTQPGNAVYSAKRLMGRGINDVRDELAMFPFQIVEGQEADGALKLKVGDRTLTPPEISALVLGQLKKNAERFFGFARYARRHHRSRVFQRCATPGHEGCRPHRRTGRPASRE